MFKFIDKNFMIQIVLLLSIPEIGSILTIIILHYWKVILFSLTLFLPVSDTVQSTLADG